MIADIEVHVELNDGGWICFKKQFDFPFAPFSGLFLTVCSCCDPLKVKTVTFEIDKGHFWFILNSPFKKDSFQEARLHWLPLGWEEFMNSSE